MLLFRSEEDIKDWCREQGMPLGQVLTLEQVWQLSQSWYGSRLEAEYTGRTAVEAEKIFRQVGLADPFWLFD